MSCLPLTRPAVTPVPAPEAPRTNVPTMDLERLQATIAAAVATVRQSREILAQLASERAARDAWDKEWRHITGEFEARLPSLITVCSSCRRFREEDGHWQEMPRGLQDVMMRGRWRGVSHGLCQSCFEQAVEEFRTSCGEAQLSRR
jgi:hypothetical protein